MVCLGEDKLRRFISLVAVASVQEDKPDSLYALAVQRARACELLLRHISTHYDPGQAFLTGLFSLLDSLLDQPLGDILEDMPVDEDIKLALSQRKGQLGVILSTVVAYEQANWELASQYQQQLGISENQLCMAYSNATEWAQELLSQTP